MDAHLAAALASLTTGIYVMTVREDDLRHGMSSSWVTQVSGIPPLILASVDKDHLTCGMIERTGYFALNVVAAGSRGLEDYFYSNASRQPDNLGAVAWEDGESGLPLLTAAAVSLECQVRQRYAAGDHVLFVAEVRHVARRSAQTPVTSLDLDYVYVGEVVKRAAL